VKNQAYMEMLGSHFVAHGPTMEFEVSISATDHDTTRRVSSFKVVDEFYILERKTQEFQVLATGTWEFKSHPMVYVRPYGKGRVFYTAMGHDQRAFENPAFQKLIYRAVRWVIGQKEGKPIRCGIVGYGGAFGMGKFHADTIRSIPGMAVTAVCDLDTARLQLAKEQQPGVATYTDVKDMAGDAEVDLGVIVTPHNTHAAVALELIAACKHVVCEKPFSLTIEESTAMIDAARAKAVMLSTFHNRRWDGDFVAIRKIIGDGLLGEVFHIEASIGGYAHPGLWWRTHKPISGGGIYDWGAHFVDWILNLMPGKIESVYGFFHKRVWFDVTNEDHCHAIIRFEGGRSADFQVSSIAAVGKPKWRILGTKGGLTYNDGDTIDVVTHVGGTREVRTVGVMKIKWDAYYLNVADHLLTGDALAVTPESARRVIAVLSLAEKASQTGQPQPVPYEDE
jgi:predicted dehydrogenase